MLSISCLRALRIAAFSVLLLSLPGILASAQDSPLDKQVSSVLPDAQTLYLDLHQHPELSSHETRTRPSWPIACARSVMRSPNT